MDVQCERCKTEYEFDDALVSGRGTTVRCTNCGHQFKVRRDQSIAPGPVQQDRWVVTTTLGKPLVYVTLRELQRAIMAKQVGRSDTLTRGDAPPRLLGSIAELEPFFEGRTSNRPPPVEASAPHAVPAIPRPPNVPRRSDASPASRTPPWGTATVPGGVQGPPAVAPSFPPPARRSAAPEPLPPARARADTLRPGLTGAPPPAMVAPDEVPASVKAALAQTVAARPPSVPPPAIRAMPAPLPTVSSPAPAPLAVAVQAAPAPLPPPPQPQQAPVATARPQYEQSEMSSPMPPPTRPLRRQLESSLGEEAMDAAMRGELLSTTGSELYMAPRRRRVGGWVIAAVLMIGVCVVGFFVARPYMSATAKATADDLDPRAKQFLVDGEKALADGDLEAAKSNFDKASALAEKDPRVLLDHARLACLRADVPWLKLRLLADSQTDEVKGAKHELEELAPRARAAADAALSAAPEEPSAIRAKIDALRISNDPVAARALAANVAGSASQPETAYVLALLDLTDAEPLWSTVVERLRLAASGEGNAGRARAALVYALARSGDKSEALTELDRLSKLTRPHPLTGALRAFVERMKGKAHAADAGPRASADASVAALDPNKLPPGAIAGEASGAIPTDTRTAIQQAHKARARGDSARAKVLYEAVVSRNPSDSEALSALGDLSRGSDLTTAMNYYKRALAVNPSYLPALIGLADANWGSGNQGEAKRLYREIMDRFPESTYPKYVKERAGEVAAPPTTPPVAPPPATTSAPANPPTNAPSTASAPGDTPTP